ncbi:MAG TPA: hypothetical protein VNW06_11260 [Cytophagaceae bacterium]|jgi:hypothetical protein|nr:hypothetical protein [Cytophagaceae bacterium]
MPHKIKFIVLLFVFSAFTAFAQTKLPNRFVEIGFSTNSYKGDLSHSYSQWANGVHIGILFNKKKRLNGHLNLMVGSAIAQNPNYFFDDGSNPQPTPNNYARIRMFAVNYDVHLNLYKKHNLIVYLYQGIGLLRFDPRASDNTHLLNDLSTRPPNETYSNICIFLPHGIGALYVSKIGFGVGFQAGFLNTMSDHIDNVALWGDRKKNDNILSYKMTVYVPFIIKNPTTAAPKINPKN